MPESALDCIFALEWAHTSVLRHALARNYKDLYVVMSNLINHVMVSTVLVFRFHEAKR